MNLQLHILRENGQITKENRWDTGLFVSKILLKQYLKRTNDFAPAIALLRKSFYMHTQIKSRSKEKNCMVQQWQH